MKIKISIEQGLIAGYCMAFSEETINRHNSHIHICFAGYSAPRLYGSPRIKSL